MEEGERKQEEQSKRSREKYIKRGKKKKKKNDTQNKTRTHKMQFNLVLSLVSGISGQ